MSIGTGCRHSRRLDFDAEAVFSICEAKRVEVVVINQDEDRAFEGELASDVLVIVTVFSVRRYGARSNKKLIDGVAKAGDDAAGA